MSIKGLKQALAKKQTQQQSKNRQVENNDIKVNQTAPVKLGNKPQKKVTGRGR